jgi:hypothetical protein
MYQKIKNGERDAVHTPFSAFYLGDEEFFKRFAFRLFIIFLAIGYIIGPYFIAALINFFIINPSCFIVMYVPSLKVLKTFKVLFGYFLDVA